MTWIIPPDADSCDACGQTLDISTAHISRRGLVCPTCTDTFAAYDAMKDGADWTEHAIYCMTVGEDDENR